MKAKFKITDPDKVECTLKITMRLSSWKKLKGKMDGFSPCWELKETIAKLIDKAEEKFESEGEFEE